MTDGLALESKKSCSFTSFQVFFIGDAVNVTLATRLAILSILLNFGTELVYA